VNNPNEPTPKRSPLVPLACLLVALIAAGALRLCVGEHFGWPQGNVPKGLWRVCLGSWSGTIGFDSLLDIRLNRLVLAVLVGWSLSTSGVALQALLRNPLAEPFILGLSSGAGVGVMAQMLLSHYLQRQVGAMHLGAMAGAMTSMMIVYLASHRRGMIDPLGLLLIGVVMSTINGAMIVLLNYVPHTAGLRDDLARWMMGYLNESLMGTASIPMMILLTASGFGVLFYGARAMDTASFSDPEAMSLGVNLHRLRFVLFVVAGTLAGGAVVLAGPVAFVGMICPHLARLLLGPRHRPLLVGSAIIGALLILMADIGSVVLDFGQGRLPLGVFTAVLGGGVFVWILRPHLGRGID